MRTYILIMIHISKYLNWLKTRLTIAEMIKYLINVHSKQRMKTLVSLIT